MASKQFEEVRNDYIREDFTDMEGDVKALITIDTWGYGQEEGSVAASVVLSAHGDILVVWHDNGARMDEDVLTAIQEAKAVLEDMKEGK